MMDSADERRGYSVAMTEAEFERMKNDQDIRVTDWTGMGTMSEFDVFVSFGVKRP